MVDKREKLEKAIDGLPKTSFGTYIFLKKRGIRGYRGSFSTCPVANYLRNETGIGVSVSSIAVVAVGVDEIPLKPGTKSFIKSFDNNRYRSLRG